MFFSGDTATCLYNAPHEDEALPRVLPGKLLSLDAQCRKDRGTSACFVGSSTIFIHTHKCIYAPVVSFYLYLINRIFYKTLNCVTADLKLSLILQDVTFITSSHYFHLHLTYIFYLSNSQLFIYILHFRKTIGYAPNCSVSMLGLDTAWRIVQRQKVPPVEMVR